MTTSTVVKKDIQKLQRAIVDGLEDVKAQDIQVFDTEHLSALFERVQPDFPSLQIHVGLPEHIGFGGARAGQNAELHQIAKPGAAAVKKAVDLDL